MYTTKITKVDTTYSQVDNGYFIDIEVEVYKDGEKFDTRRFGFPLGTAKEIILSEMTKLCETLASDEEVGKASAELDRQMTEVQSLKEQLLS